MSGTIDSGVAGTSGRTRTILAVFTGMPASDGAGVKLTRVIGTPILPDLDPFLMLDEFGSDDPQAYIGGFPDHPHRGFETVTYMLAGRMRHWDNKGNTGLLEPGSVQWMTAGSGLVHSEMPEQEDGLMAGFQLWINLPAASKMCAPRYQDIAPDAIPVVDAGSGAAVKVIAGSFGGRRGPVEAEATQPIYLDVVLSADGRFETPLPAEHNAFVYVYDGALSVGPEGEAQTVSRGQLGVLRLGDTVAAKASSRPARFLLVAGRPLREPIVKHGPFVMNTPQEIRQAIEDYRVGRF